MLYDHPMTSRTRTTILWVALFLVCAVLFGSTVHHELGDMGGDSAMYVLLAKSLVTGHGYRDLHDPWLRPHVKYPPLFPLMLAPLVAAFGAQTFWPMHLLVVCWAVASVLLAVVLLRALGEGPAAWLAGWATAVHPWFVMAVVCLWTEFPYLGCSLLALYGLHRYRESTTINNRWLWLAVAGTAATALTRVVGWTLIFAGVCSLWSRARLPASGNFRGQAGGGRSRRPLLVWLSLTLLPVGGWAIRNLLHRHAATSYGYLEQMRLIDPYHASLGGLNVPGLLQRLWAAAVTYTDLLGHLLSGGAWPAVISRLMVAVLVVGWVAAWRRRRSILEWYLLWYAAALLLHPWREERFLLPIIPLLWQYLWIGGRWCVARLARFRWSRLVRVGLLACLTITLIAQGVATAQLVWLRHQEYTLPPPEVLAREPWRRPIQWTHIYDIHLLSQQPAMLVAMTDYLGMLDWLRRYYPTRTFVLSRKPSITTLFSDQPSDYYPFTLDAETWRAAVLDRGLPVAVLADRWTGTSLHYAWPFIAAHPELFEPVHTVGSATLFLVVGPSEGRRR